MTYNLAKCPNCLSLNIYPQGKTWHCNNCGKNFDQAMVELEPPEPKKKGGKRR